LRITFHTILAVLFVIILLLKILYTAIGTRSVKPLLSMTQNIILYRRWTRLLDKESSFVDYLA